MRDWIQTLSLWNTKEKAEEKPRLNIYPTYFDQYKLDETSINAFTENEIKKDQVIYLYGFDFSEEKFTHLINAIITNYRNDIFFCNVTFNYTQLLALLENGADFSATKVILKGTINYQCYKEIYDVSYTDNRASLEKIIMQVSFDGEDIKDAGEEFLNFCIPKFLKKITLSENQLYSFSQHQDIIKIDLAKFNLTGIDISPLFKKPGLSIEISDNTQISNGMTLDTKALARCYHRKDFERLFNRANFSFSLKWGESVYENMSVPLLLNALSTLPEANLKADTLFPSDTANSDAKKLLRYFTLMHNSKSETARTSIYKTLDTYLLTGSTENMTCDI